jgi:hypothetical protein
VGILLKLMQVGSFEMKAEQQPDLFHAQIPHCGIP